MQVNTFIAQNTKQIGDETINRADFRKSRSDGICTWKKSYLFLMLTILSNGYNNRFIELDYSSIKLVKETESKNQ